MSPPPLVLGGRTAVVTGAASGIGRALALAAAGKRMHVAICDMAAERLQETARSIRDAGGTVTSEAFDVRDRDAIDRFARRACEELPPVALVFANAGVLRQGSVVGMSLSEWRLLYEVNVLGVVGVLSAFVPAMIQAAEPAQIVITGSTGAMSNPEGLTAYCSTKHALWPISEGLRAELEAVGAPIGVSFLMPGAVATRIFDAASPDRLAPIDSIEPAKVAEIVFDRIDANPEFILTHPHFIDRAEARFADVIAKLRG